MNDALAAPEEAGLQRARGRASADIHVAAGRSRLARLHQAGCLKLRFPTPRDASAEAVLINSSGGLTGGDRLTQSFKLADRAELSVTTQACERIYRSSGGEARVATTIDVAAGASLAFLPQETIFFDGGALRRRLDIHCQDSSRLLVAESVILGRTLMGETVRTGSIRDAWRIRRGDRLVFADALRFDGEIDRIGLQPASLAGAKAFSTILCQTPDPRPMLEEIRGLMGGSGGASAFDGLIVARIVAADGFALRKRLLPVLSALAEGPLPRIWSI